MLRKSILDNPNTYVWEPDPCICKKGTVVPLLYEDWPVVDTGCLLGVCIEYHEFFMTSVYAKPIHKEKIKQERIHVYKKYILSPGRELANLKKRKATLEKKIEEHKNILEQVKYLTVDVENLEKLEKTLGSKVNEIRYGILTVKHLKQLVEGLPDEGVIEVRSSYKAQRELKENMWRYLSGSNWRISTYEDIRVLKFRTDKEEAYQQLVPVDKDGEDLTRL